MDRSDTKLVAGTTRSRPHCQGNALGGQGHRMADGFPQASAAPGEPLPGRRLGNRFELLQRMKAGRGISTWLGSDLRTGGRVVIKVTSANSLVPTSRQRLEHEASVL